jgi:signal transduction histidine kinase
MSPSADGPEGASSDSRAPSIDEALAACGEDPSPSAPPEGEHVCAFHADDGDRVTAVASFIQRGFSAGHKALYLGEETTTAPVLTALEKSGLDVAAALSNGRLSRLPGREFYGAGGAFDPARTTGRVRGLIAEARSAGFSGLTLIGERIDAGANGDERFPVYEAQLNTLGAEAGLSAMCTHDRERLSATTMLPALRTHPRVVIGVTRCLNPHYLPPGPYLAANRDQAELDWMLDDLLRARERCKAKRAFDVRQRDVHRRLLEQQEQERRALARDLHDALAQILASLHMHLDRGSRGDDFVDGLMKDAMEYVRGLGRDLRPSVLDDLGLAPALRSHLGRTARRAGLEAHAELGAIEDRTLTTSIQTTVFRLVQEAVGNIVRHAHATRVWLSVTIEGDTLELIVRDDGRGFDSALAPGTALGLAGMRERAELAGGSLSVGSTVGRGTVVRARLPVEPAR